MRIVLIGFATSYKTSAGKLLAEILKTDFFDVDAEVEKAEGKTVSEIFADSGEEYFRKAEKNVLQRLKSADAVIACGGGSVLLKNFAEFAGKSTVVWLQTSAQTIKTRLHTGRPLFDGLSVEQLQRQVAAREEAYKTYASLCVQTDGKTSCEVAEEIWQKLH